MDPAHITSWNVLRSDIGSSFCRFRTPPTDAATPSDRCPRVALLSISVRVNVERLGREFVLSDRWFPSLARRRISAKIHHDASGISFGAVTIA